MPSVLEKQLFRLSGLRESWMEVELTPEEASKLTELPAPIRGATHHPGNLGYIDPTKVKRYFVEELGRAYEGSPDLYVTIYFPNSSLFMGGYWFIHREETGKEFGVFTGPVYEGDAIDVRYIVEDNSGKFIPITRERIEAKIREAYESIAKGFGGSSEIEDAKRFAEVAGLDFSEQLKELKRYADDDELRRYNEPTHLRGLIERLSGILEFARSEYLDESGEGKKLDEFLRKLPRLTIPPDLVESVQHIIAYYRRAYDRDIEAERGKIEEAEERIRELEAERSAIGQYTNDQLSFS